MAWSSIPHKRMSSPHIQPTKQKARAILRRPNDLGNILNTTYQKERNTRGASVLTQEVLSKAQELLNEGEGISETATKLGIKKDTLRKAIKSGRLQEVKREADCLFELPKVSW